MLQGEDRKGFRLRVERAMAKKKVAVVTIHGMGAQYKNLESDPKEPTYSAGLRERVRDRLGAADFDAKVGWFEVYWADVLQARQEKYADALKKQKLLGRLRQFVMYNLSDAACYYPIKGDVDSTYSRVHDRITAAIKAASADAEPDAPLVIAAHSLGGHMISNYTYDLCKVRQPAGPPYNNAFRNLETFRTFFTFGCNIPVFIFSTKKPVPIQYPGMSDGPPGRTWWFNYFDPDDPLGFPLAAIGGGYNDLAKRNELKDVLVDSGGLLTSWNPWSHNEYWTDSDIYNPITAELQRLLQP